MANPLTKQFRGRPMWVWALVAVGGVLLGRLIVSRRAASSDVPAVDTSSATNANLPAISPARLAAVTPVPASQAPTAGPATNDQWSRVAAAMLVGAGNIDPVAAEQALSRYLSGRDITPEERGIINKAIQLAGPPPEGSPVVDIINPVPMVPPMSAGIPVNVTPAVEPGPAPVPASPAPTPAPAPVAAPGRTYTVQPGDNLTWIGAQHGTSWNAIYEANTNQISDPNLIYPGQVLVIP